MQFLKIFLGVLALSNALVLTLPFQVRAADAQSDDPAYILIHAGQLLAIPGQPPERIKTIVIHGDSVMEIRDGFIEAQSLGLADGQTAETIDLREHFVLPGLMDAHVHLMWSGSDRPPKKQDQLNTQDLTLWTLRNARAALSAGFTTVRDMAADPDVMFAVRDWINGGKFLGPRILAAGRPVGALGGHGDTTAVGMDPGELSASGLCDGVESCRRAVRVQHKQGSDVIKMMATGGFHDQTGTDQLFFFDEMEATVVTAHQLHLTVAAHAYSGVAIADAVRAGVDSIDHGFGAADATLKAMKKQNIYLVPTLSIAQRKDSGTTRFRDKHRAFERALEIGTPIAFGTDVGGIPHKFAAREFIYMVDLGMSPAAALESATISTAKLFRIGDQVGTLETGKLADIIALEGNPLDDILALGSVDFVMKSGRVAKRDGVLVDFFLD